MRAPQAWDLAANFRRSNLLLQPTLKHSATLPRHNLKAYSRGGPCDSPTFLPPRCFAWALRPTTDTKPEFEIAGVHASTKTDNQPINQFMRSSAARGRYEMKNATMADLIRTAYGYDPDKILGGPNWLELDRFDIVAKMPEDTTPDDRKLMLQALLADRFKLVLHKDSKPLPTYALIAGKKPSMKEATGEEQAGCKPDASSGSGPPPTGGRLFTSGPNGPIIIDLGPGGTVHFTCRNMTMAAFASGLRNMPGVGNAVGTNPVLDDTGLKGARNLTLGFPCVSAEADQEAGTTESRFSTLWRSNSASSWKRGRFRRLCL